MEITQTTIESLILRCLIYETAPLMEGDISEVVMEDSTASQRTVKTAIC